MWMCSLCLCVCLLENISEEQKWAKVPMCSKHLHRCTVFLQLWKVTHVISCFWEDWVRERWRDMRQWLIMNTSKRGRSSFSTSSISQQFSSFFSALFLYCTLLFPSHTFHHTPVDNLFSLLSSLLYLSPSFSFTFICLLRTSVKLCFPGLVTYIPTVLMPYPVI